MLFARRILLFVAVVSIRTVDALAAKPANLRRLSLSASCSALAAPFATMPDSSCGALPSSQITPLLSPIEEAVPGCDLSSQYAAFDSLSNCADLTRAFEDFCNTAGTCASGGTSSSGGSTSSEPTPVSSPSPPRAPPPPKTIDMTLQLNVASANDITSAMITAIQDTFVAYLNSTFMLLISRDDVAVSVPSARRQLHDITRRLQGTVPVGVSMTVPPTADDSAISSDLSSTATQESLTTTMAASGVDVASMTVTSSSESKSKSSDNTGVIVGAVIGSIVGLLLLGAVVYMCMKKKAVVDVKAAA